MAEVSKRMQQFVFKATVAAIERVNSGMGDPDEILELLDRVVTLYNTNYLTKTQLNVLVDLLDVDIDIPIEPEEDSQADDSSEEG